MAESFGQRIRNPRNYVPQGFLKNYSGGHGMGRHTLDIGSSALRGAGRAMMHPFAGYGMIGLPLEAMSHDPTKDTFASHMAKASLRTAADAANEWALASAGMAIGGVPGAAIAIGGSIIQHLTGTNPGAAIEHMYEGAAKLHRKKKMMGPKPITQNERTMKATQVGLSLLRQSAAGGHNMLGSEAQYMHN